ncbi:MAG: hypothetical protein C0598_06420, partial [Marinilabiliales bacterium]
MAFLIDDRFLFQIYGEGMFEIVNDKFIHISGTKNIPDVVSVVPSSDDNFYYFCSKGEVFKGNPSKRVVKIEMPEFIGLINQVIPLSDGTLAAGTQNNGLFILDKELNIIKHFTKNEGLSDRTVKALYEDDCHNLWVALNNGIDYLELSLPLTLINDDVGLEGTGYAAQAFKNDVYLGTNNGLFIQEDEYSELAKTYYKLLPGSEGQVYNFSVVGDELLLNHNRGSFQITNNKLIQFHDIGSWEFIETGNPDVIIGGNYQGMSFFNKKNNTWFKSGSIPDFTESSRILEYENDSTLWMTHGSKGAYRLILDENLNLKRKIEHFGIADGFPSNLMITVYSLNGKLIFTSERGIFNFNNGSNSFVPNEFFNKWLGKNHVSAIASGSNNVFYIQDQKFGRLSQENFGTYKIQTNLFRHINEFINDDLPNISIIDDNNVLIGAKEGFILYKPNKKYFIRKDFNVILKSVEIQASSDSIKKYNPTYIENSKFQKQQSFTFNYAAPYFDGYQYVQYSYRLLPLEAQWSNWSNSASKEYTYLPAGDYRFEVKAINIYGKESPVKTLSFIVVNPWYISNYAIAFYIIIIFIVIALILIFQKKKYVEENIQISKKSEKALKIKSEEINQLSLNSKMEIDRLNNEKLRSELNLKNDQLTTITLHHMNTNEFIQDIRKKIDLFIN